MGDKKTVENKPKKKYNVNRKGFYTNNNTQKMESKDVMPMKQRGITLTTEDSPSGENSLPTLH